MEIISLIVSAASLIVAIYSIKSSNASAKKQQEFELQLEEMREQKRKEEKRIALQDEIDARREIAISPFAMGENERARLVNEKFLSKQRDRL